MSKEPVTEQAIRAVSEIIRDMEGRRGLAVWGSIDEDTREEIECAWIKIIMREMKT